MQEQDRDYINTLKKDILDSRRERTLTKQAARDLFSKLNDCETYEEARFFELPLKLAKLQGEQR